MVILLLVLVFVVTQVVQAAPVAPVSPAMCLFDTSTVFIKDPEDGSVFLTDTVQVIGSASSDKAVVSKVEVKVNNGIWQLASGTTSWNAFVGLSPGSNTIYASVTDTCGATAEYSVTVILDEPPTIAITSPSNGQIFTAGTVTVTGTASDKIGLSKVEVKLNNGNWQLASINWGIAAYVPVSWSASLSLNPGTNTIYARATDSAGKTNELQLAVIYDIIPPTITITSPAGGQIFTTGTVTVSGTASDTSGLSKVDISINSGAWQPVSGTTTWSTSVILSPGTNTIRARATDISGKITENIIDVSYIKADTTLPRIFINSPFNGQSFANNAIVVSGVASDDIGISRVEIKVNSGNWQPVSGTTIWDTSVILSPGTNTIRARATDTSGNTAENIIYVSYITVDTTLPQISINSPFNGQSFANNAIVVSGVASDDMGIDRIEVKVNSGIWQLVWAASDDMRLEIMVDSGIRRSATGTTLYRKNENEVKFKVDSGIWLSTTETISWSTSVILSPGNNTIYARAMDTSGNFAEDTAEVIYDVLPPVIEIISPSNEQYSITNTITVRGVAYDNVGLSKIEVKVNNGIWQLASGTGIWSKRLTLPPGRNTIYIRATDIFGNIRETSITVNCQPLPLIFAIALIVALTVGSAASVSTGSILNKLSEFWRRLDEIVREFLKVGAKSVYLEAEEKIMSGLFREGEEVKEINDKGEIKRLIIAGAIIFFAIALEFYPHSHEIITEIDPLIFLFALALFSMIAEIGHDQALEISLRSIGARSIFELSLMGILITIVSGILGFPILAAGGTRILHRFENSRKDALIASSGSLFNLTLGILFLIAGSFMNAPWLALAGALPNLANAAFSLFPNYPFEGRWVFRGSKGIWGGVFFMSIIFYLSVIF